MWSPSINATSPSYCKPERRAEEIGWGVKGRMHTATPQEYLLWQVLVAKSCQMLRQSNISMLPTGWTHFKSCTAASSVTLVLLPVWSQLSCIRWQKPGIWWVHSVVSEVNTPINQMGAITSPSKGPELCLGMGRENGKVREHLPFWQWAATSVLIAEQRPFLQVWGTSLCSLVLSPKTWACQKADIHWTKCREG